MKRLVLAVLLVVCGVNADDYEEFLEYKKWQEQKAKSQGKDSAKSGDSAKANATDSTQEDYKNLLKSRKDSSQNANQGDSIKTSDSAKNTAKNTQDSKDAGFIGLEFGFNLGSKAKFIEYSGITKTYSGILQADTGSFNALNASLIGGYQWYFSDMMGVGVRGLIGYSGSVAYTTFALTAIAWGVEAQYLLDFTRNVGMNIGVGFEASHLIYADVLISSSVFNPAFSASLGLHFRTSNLKHNFGITYRYRTYKTKTIKTANTTMDFSQGKAGLLVFLYAYRF